MRKKCAIEECVQIYFVRCSMSLHESDGSWIEGVLQPGSLCNSHFCAFGLVADV